MIEVEHKKCKEIAILMHEKLYGIGCSSTEVMFATMIYLHVIAQSCGISSASLLYNFEKFLENSIFEE